MKNFLILYSLSILITIPSVAQLPAIKVQNGQIRIDDGRNLFTPDKKQFSKIIDSLNNNLRSNPNDTTSLFFSALFLLTYNNMSAEPYQRTKGTLENLNKAKNMVEKAVALNMNNPALKIARANIYGEITYRYTGDESWQFKTKTEIATRHKDYNFYKELANKYFDELVQLHPNDSYTYQKLKVKGDYPIR